MTFGIDNGKGTTPSGVLSAFPIGMGLQTAREICRDPRIESSISALHDVDRPAQPISRKRGCPIYPVSKSVSFFVLDGFVAAASVHCAL